MSLPTSLRTVSARNEVERFATKFLAANDNPEPKGREPVYRGGRPAFNWAAKVDQYGAACVWLIARQRLPASMIAANDNEPQQGGLDTRRNGTARGKVKPKTNLGAHLDLPAVIPPLGSADSEPLQPCGYTRLDILPQNDVEELSDDFRSFGACADAVGEGAIFIGAESGLGTPRPGKSKGSPMRIDDASFDVPPSEIDYVLELLLAGETVSGIANAFGAKGRYRDKKGAALLRAAMDWAKSQVEETNFRRHVTN